MDVQYTGHQISQMRKSRNMTQRELAEKLHVTDKAVSKWERGINFPDLGLLENLAEALDTTPAVLLGLENADQSETLTTLTEISEEQLEETRKDIRAFAWGSAAAALALILGYSLMQKGAVEAHYLLRSLIFLMAHIGWWYLFKYDEIKKWEPKDLGTFFASLLPILLWQGHMFITGSSLSQAAVWLLVGISCIFAQIHFIQVMRPRFMQLLPLMLSILYMLWQLFLGCLESAEWIPAGCCLAVSAVDALLHPGKRKINWKALGIGLSLVLAVIFLVCITCYDSLIHSYVRANQKKLEDYAQSQLENGHGKDYGPWDVTVYPELGLVEFRTGGSGLVPGAIYEGFYYSASGEHIPFPGFGEDAEITGDTAWFYDPAENSDNWQQSTRISDYLYWFELHY